jgi:hypothetical protein
MIPVKVKAKKHLTSNKTQPESGGTQPFKDYTEAELHYIEEYLLQQYFQSGI